MVPSLGEVMLAQSFALPTELSSVQVGPESAEVQMVPLVVPLTVASLVPSLEEVTPHQNFVLPTEVSSVQVSPESVEVQIEPLVAQATSFEPSLEDAMLRHQ